MLTKATELLNLIENAPNDAQAEALMVKLGEHLSEQRHRPRLNAVVARLANWINYHFEREELLGFCALGDAPAATFSDQAVYDRRVHKVYVAAAPDVEERSEVVLDEVDINASGGQNCILRFRIGAKWYIAAVEVNPE